jgi:protein phosphatase
MIIRVTDPSVVVLMGASGAGKSTFARTHFKPTEVLSSDFFRGLVSDDENSQSSSAAAFDVLYYVAKKRLEAYKLVVIDATNTDAAQRAVALKLARELHVLATAIVLDLPVEVCRAHNAARPDRQFGDHVLRRHVGAIRRSLRTLRSEGFRQYYVLSSPEEVAAATVERQRLWNDKREERGPFDIIGDVHGCYQELRALLMELGWAVSGTREQPEVVAPPGRRAIFLGDLVDRGPDSPGVLRLVMHMHAQGLALVIPGNHEVKLKKALDGAAVRPTHGLAETLAQLAAEPDVEALKARVSRWIDGLVSHYVLDEGRLVVAHAGLSEELQGRASARVREFALYGDTTGETDEFGLPVRYPWAREYRGRAAVVYGHTPVPEAEWLNGTLCLDTGCVFGGKLTALRWPEKVLVEVPAERTYYEPHRPLPTVGAAREAVALDINDVRGRRYVETRLGPPVAVRPENAAACAGGDGALHGGPALAGVPTAHDVAAARGAGGGAAARATRRGAGLLCRGGCGRAGVRGEAHGLARGRGAVPRRVRGGAALRHRWPWARRDLYAHRAALLHGRGARAGALGAHRHRDGSCGAVDRARQ